MEIIDLSFPERKLYEFDEIVESHQPDLPHHNKSHNQDASLKTIPQIKWCKRNGLYVRDVPIVMGMRGHDLGLHEDFVLLGYEKPEEYAADLAASAMSELGFDEELDIKPAKENIVITNPLLTPTTVPHKISRRADVANIGEEFIPFVAISGHLWQEKMIVSREQIGYEAWAYNTCSFLTNLVLGPDLSLGEFDRDDTGQAFFQRRAREHVAKLGRMVSLVAEIFESVPGPAEGSPLPDYAALLVQRGIG